MSPAGFRSGVPALVRSTAELPSWNNSHYKVWLPLLSQFMSTYRGFRATGNQTSLKTKRLFYANAFLLIRMWDIVKMEPILVTFYTCPGKHNKGNVFQVLNSDVHRGIH